MPKQRRWPQPSMGSTLGLLNISHRWPINLRHETGIINRREGSKKFVQRGRSYLDARSVLSVREHGQTATCLREVASAGMEPLACQP